MCVGWREYLIADENNRRQPIHRKTTEEHDEASRRRYCDTSNKQEMETEQGIASRGEGKEEIE
jgi:hypothetical protein